MITNLLNVFAYKLVPEPEDKLRLDPVTVIYQDIGPGQGRMIVECYGRAWAGYWGGMGDRDICTFVKQADVDYLAGVLLSGMKHTKADRSYLERILTLVKQSLE